MISSRLFLLFLYVSSAYGWDNDELEIFDLVEEVNQNFYDVLGVPEKAEAVDIRKAYRRLSVKLHPDKNKEPDAEEKFRQLVAVYEILKDEKKRKRYDEVLVTGLPDWRMPVYYYRRVRKLGLLELMALLFMITSIGHYIVIWSIYVERRFEKEEVFRARRKRERKGKKGRQSAEYDDEDEELEEHLSTIPRPSFSDFIPIQLVVGTVKLVVSTPGAIASIPQRYADYKQAKLLEEQQLQQAEQDDKDMEEKAKVKRQRIQTPHIEPEMADDIVPVIYTQVSANSSQSCGDDRNNRAGQPWTDEEIGNLAKAVARFPPGTQNRWERIAEAVNRPVKEATKKAAQMKTGYAISVKPSVQGTTGLPEEVGSTDISSMQIPLENTADNKPDSSKQKQKKTLVIPKGGITVLSSDVTSNGDSDQNTIVMQKETGAKSESQESECGTEGPEAWTQNQQKILEWALTVYPKGTPQHWEKIAEHIPGKSKDDCVQRFKYLALLVQNRKKAAEKSS